MTPFDNTRAPLLERPLPHSAESERVILGALLLNNSLIALAIVTLKPEHFYVHAHQFIFSAMLKLAERGEELSPVLLGEELRRQGQLEQVGGVSFIAELTHGLPQLSNIYSYAKVVRDKADVRQIVKASHKTASAALEDEDDVDVMLDTAEGLLAAIRAQRRGTGGGTVRTMRQVLEGVNAEFSLWKQGKASSLPTGLPELDEKLKLKGFAPPDLIYIAAPPSRGKTALALQIIRYQAKHKIARPLIFSIEMSAEALGMRLLSSESRVAHWKFRPDIFADVNREDVQKIAGVFGQVEDLAIFVDDQTRDLGRLCMIAQQFVEDSTTAVNEIVVDYTQLVNSQLKGATREREVAHVSSTLKDLGKRLRVPVVATSQLRKTGNTQDRNARPEIEDLRDSYQLAQDADLVLMPYGALTDRDKRPMKIYCPKQRNGRVGWEIDVDFKGDWQTFFTETMTEDELREEWSARGDDFVGEDEMAAEGDDGEA